MIPTRLFSTITVLLVVQLACLSVTPPPSVIPPTGPTTADQPIGLIRQLAGGVEAGPESALEPVNPSRDLFDNEAARVFNNGKAQLDFGYGLTLTLYNDTATAGTKVAASKQVFAKLAQGGLLGYNPPGSRTEVQLANNATVIILGTTYFITYDPASQIGSAFNFDGSMSYAVAGSSPVELPQRALVVFNATQVIRIYTDLRFTPEGFDAYASSHNSPVQGLAAMENEYLVPAAPQPFSPENRATLSSAPTLQWILVDQGRKYQVQVSTDAGFSSTIFDTAADLIQWTIPEPLPMGVYYWRVRGLSPFDAAGEWSEVRSFTVSLPPEAPVLQEPGDGQFVTTATPGFGWQAVANAARYQIQVSYQPDFGSLAFDASSSGTGWTLPSGLSMGSYYWRVRGINSFETAGPWSGPRAFTVSLPPGAPVLVDPADNFVMNHNAPKFVWQDTPNAARYQIQVGYNSDFSNLAYDDSASTTYWSPPAVLPMGQYYWHVRGFSSFETPGPWSNSRSFIVSLPPGVPLLRAPQDGSTVYQNDTLAFYWGDVSNASYYEIQIMEQGGSFDNPIYDQNLRGTKWTLPGIIHAKMYYYWRVRALNQYGTPGHWSETWRFYMQSVVD